MVVFPPAFRLPDHFFHGLLNRVDGLLGSLLGLADCLVGPSFFAKLVVAGQRAGGFLDSTFHYVCLATMMATPFS